MATNDKKNSISVFQLANNLIYVAMFITAAFAIKYAAAFYPSKDFTLTVKNPYTFVSEYTNNTIYVPKETTCIFNKNELEWKDFCREMLNGTS